MTRSFVTKVATVAAVAAAAIAPSAAQAQNTVLNFSGGARISDPDPVVGSGNTLVIDFLVNGNTTGAAPGTIIAGSNDFGFPSQGTNGTISDIVAVPFPPGVQDLPISSFVNIGGYTFALTSTDQGSTFGPISLTQAGVNVSASFNVFGTVTGGAFGTRARNFTGIITSQFTNTTVASIVNRIDSGRGLRRDFSATFTVATIPEPSTYALMASGVAMLGAFARRRRQQA